MNRGASLVDQVRGLLERTYHMVSGLDDLGRFLIGDHGYQLFYADTSQVQDVGSPFGARTLVRETERGLRAAVYLPDALIRTLEAHPPQRGLGDENVQPFATLVEEIDHLLFLAERARASRPVSLFELELHANVSKHLVLSRFLAGRKARLAPGLRVWLRHHLFHGVRYTEDDPEVRRRYEDAARWAVRYLDALADELPPRRLASLRRFHAEDAAGKLRLIDRAA